MKPLGTVVLYKDVHYLIEMKFKEEDKVKCEIVVHPYTHVERRKITDLIQPKLGDYLKITIENKPDKQLWMVYHINEKQTLFEVENESKSRTLRFIVKHKLWQIPWRDEDGNKRFRKTEIEIVKKPRSVRNNQNLI